MSRLKGEGKGKMRCDKVWQGETGSSACAVTPLWKKFYALKQYLPHLLVSDKMPTDSAAAERWLLWLKLFFIVNYCM